MKKLMVILLIVVMSLAVVIPAFAAPDAKKVPAWIVEGFAAAKAQGTAIANVPGIAWNRGNASGDKISSNAHSMDFDGIYFEWDEKQKDPGVLLIRADVFDMFVGETFKVTAKNSNSYYGYQVSSAQTSNIVSYTSDGVAVYGYVIPKQVQNDKGKTEDLKNINMIFIDGEYKDGELIITKTWFDWQGQEIQKPGDVADAAFGVYPSVGTYPVKVTSWGGATITVKENAMPGFSTKVNGKAGASVTLTIKATETKTAAFENQEQPATVNISKVWKSADEVVAGDNSLVELSGAWVLGSQDVAPGTEVDFYEEAIVGFSFAGLSVNGVESDINLVKFTAARGTVYNIVFTNVENITPKGSLELEKWVDGSHISYWAFAENILDITEYIEGFELYALDDEYDTIAGKVAIDFCEIDLGGVILFEEIDEGWYAIAEVLTDLGKEYFEEVAPLVVYFDGNNILGGAADVAYASGPDYGTVVAHNGSGVNHALPSVWNEALAGEPAFAKLTEMGAQWIWDTENTYVYGVSGSVFEATKVEVTVAESVTVPFYFACDNAAVVYVNGKLAGYTTVALRNSLAIGAAYDPDVFAFLDNNNFDGRWNEGWVHAYETLITLEAGLNEIIVIGANSKRTENTGTANDSYDNTNNPCGLIFGFVAPGKTVFENKTLIEPKYVLSMEKYVDMKPLTLWMQDNGAANITEYIAGFELYKAEQYVDGDFVGAPYLPALELDISGAILFGEVEAGEYYIAEVLTALGEKCFFRAEPLFIEVINGDIEARFENTTIPKEPAYEYPNINKIPSDSHIARWFNAYGIYCLAGNTTDSGNYFIVFDADKFDFDKYAEVTVRYGSNITDDRNEFTFSTEGEFEEITYNGKTYYGVVYEFANIFGSGAMHAYLYSLLLAD